MRSYFIFILSGLLLLSGALRSQESFIRGTVYDVSTGETLPGVSVLISGTTTGTISDLDGKFSIPVKPGDYDLTLSYVSYESMTIKGVEVPVRGTSLLENIRMEEATFSLNEVTIQAQAVRNTENALFTIKKKSANVIDGISATHLKRTGDSDAASSIKRVTGVSVEGGKYVYIRGLGDRYTKTVLNGVDIPGLDPDRNTLQMDIFPTNIIDNIIIHKSFCAELPADFTGGMIDINIKDFPEEKTGSISAGLAYNPSMHFHPEYLTYKGGSTDFLGFDDGTRDIPATSNIPFFTEVVGNPEGQKAQRYKEILRDFNPVMSAYKQSNTMDQNFGFTFGNQSAKRGLTVGYNLAFSYKNETEFYENAEFGRYGLSGNPDTYEMEVREFQTGNYGLNNVLISGLAGFAVKTLQSRYRITVMHLQNGESKAGIFDYHGSDQGSNFNGIQHNLDYSQRSLSTLMIAGAHSFHDADWQVEWKISPTLATMEDPDVRFTRYEDRSGKWSIGTESGFPERIWRDLNEVNLAGIFLIKKDFDLNGRNSGLQMGGAYTFKERDYNILSYAFNVRDIPLTGNPDELFYTENLWPYHDDLTRGTTYEARFIPSNPNQFNSTTSNAAAYVSADLWILRKLKAIVGVRLENYTQRYTGQDQLGLHVLDHDVVLDDLGFFPSVNFVYSFTDEQNLRFSYSKTIARPSFKELSYAEIYDPITGRTFVGGLFRDANDAAGIVYWDGELISTDIHNFDLRYEMYWQDGQMFSIGGYYKKFFHPIEVVQYSTLVGAFQPRNTGDGEVLGAEAELRINSESFSGSLRHLLLILNFTYAESRIALSRTEYESRLENARTGQSVELYRDMAGQAPYLVNAGILYEGGKAGILENLEAGLFYNVRGGTLLFAGIVDRPDIYTQPFHSLNFNASKKLGRDNRYQVGLKIENILNQKTEAIFRSYEAMDEYFTRLDPGMKFSLRFSYDLSGS